ncbi:hypothetical protein [Streptomyces sp. NBC_00847]|uniref:hypothetical protein n=1 Tax=Streptomyces sp. NBC_00847 TaxID=2975850 RepID=UPI00225DF641|nr:hypothetical protein [Streptomyces sp. NBC_00847]MCX4885971.1 hypothetical protein [Streptomyces sp. NBC_00847]
MSSANPAPPPIWVTLPDGQEVRGQLYERRQWQLGGWMYLVGLAMWANEGDEEHWNENRRLYAP